MQGPGWHRWAESLSPLPCRKCGEGGEDTVLLTPTWSLADPPDDRARQVLNRRSVRSAVSPGQSSTGVSPAIRPEATPCPDQNLQAARALSARRRWPAVPSQLHWFGRTAALRAASATTP